MDDSEMKVCCNCKYFVYLAWDNMRTVCILNKIQGKYKSTGYYKSCKNFYPDFRNYHGIWQECLF